MARIEWVQRRLVNWALWKERQGSGGLGYASASIFAGGPVGTYGAAEAKVPVDEIDASITDDAVEAMKLGNGHLHRTLHLFYVRNLGIKGTAVAMQRAESTVHANLAHADQVLASWFEERHRRGAAAAASMSVRSQLSAGPAIAAHLAKREEARQERAAGKGKRKRARNVGAALAPTETPVKVRRSRPTLSLRKPSS